MTGHKIGEVVSLALTSPTVISGFIVVAMFSKPAWRALVTKEKRTPYQWLILGVTASFVGGVLDNVWWGVAWGHFFTESHGWQWWFFNGVYSNIPCRQLAGLIAAGCHIKSVWESGATGCHAWKLAIFNWIMIVSTLASVVFWVSMVS